MIIRRLLFVSLAIGPPSLLCPDAGAQAPDNSRVLQSVGTFGLALGKELLTAAQASRSQRQSTPSQASASQLQAVEQGYIRSRDLSRGGINLLNTDLQIVYTGIDVQTAGTAMAGTLTARWLTSKAIEAMKDSSDESIRERFASDLKAYITTNNLDLTARNNSGTDDIRAVLDALPSVRNLKTKLGDDPGAADVVDASLVTLYRSASLATLDQLDAANKKIDSVTGQVINNEQNIIDINQNINSFKDSTNGALTDLSSKIDRNTDALNAGQQQLADIQDELDENTQQMGVMQDLLYSHASAADRLSLLQTGYKQNQLSSTEYAALLQSTKAEAEHEALSSQVNRVVTSIGDLNTIANNLHFIPSAVREGLGIASTVGAAASKVLSGDFLGALAGLTGLFGGGPSTADIVIDAMNKRFDVVDSKLNDLSHQQQALGRAVLGLSDQVSDLKQDMQLHLNAVDARLDTIHGFLRESYYMPLANCQAIKSDVERAAESLDQGPVNMRSFKQMPLINAVNATFSQVHDCITFLNFINRQTTGLQQGSAFRFEPLAMRYLDSDSTIPRPSTDPGKTQDYNTASAQYMQAVYSPAISYVVSRSQRPVFGHLSDVSHTLMLSSIPVNDVASLRRKFEIFAESGDTCTKQTVLSSPLVSMLCPATGATQADILKLSSIHNPITDRSANDAAQGFLKSPIFADALDELSDWAQFYAPIADYEDAGHNTFSMNQTEFFSRPIVLPNGLTLLKGALSVDTLGIAQTDAIYGDVVAAMVFEDLWDEQKGFAADAAAINGDQKQAADLLLSGNSFLAKNVLMIALDHARKDNINGWDFAYAFGIDYIAKAELSGDAVLARLFQNKIHFSSVWRAKAAASLRDAHYCESLSGSDRSAKCFKVPVANILGTAVDLPTTSEFSARRLSYPQLLSNLIKKRDSLAAAIADYNAIDFAVGPTNGSNFSKQQLSQSILEALQ